MSELLSSVGFHPTSVLILWTDHFVFPLTCVLNCLCVGMISINLSKLCNSYVTNMGPWFKIQHHDPSAVQWVSYNKVRIPVIFMKSTPFLLFMVYIIPAISIQCFYITLKVIHMKSTATRFCTRAPASQTKTNGHYCLLDSIGKKMHFFPSR